MRGVIFDMDGTLTEPVLDFVKMRKRVGLALGRDIGRGDMLGEVNKEPSETRREAAPSPIRGPHPSVHANVVELAGHMAAPPPTWVAPYVPAPSCGRGGL